MLTSQYSPRQGPPLQQVLLLISLETCQRLAKICGEYLKKLHHYFNFSKDFKSTDILTDREEFLSEEDERSISALLVDQLDFADVVIMNKISECTDQEIYKTLMILI